MVVSAKGYNYLQSTHLNTDSHTLKHPKVKQGNRGVTCMGVSTSSKSLVSNRG